MAKLAFILAAALWATSQQEPEELSVEEELAALIEKTNALETLHLVYDMEHSGDQWPSHGSFEFVYRAPDLFRLHIKSDEGAIDSWIDGAQMVWWSNVDGEGDGDWHRATMPEPLPESLLLDELFPRTERPLGPGVFLQMTVRDNPETGRAAFQFSATMAFHGRTVVLGWLDVLDRRSSELSTEGDSFVLEGEHFRLRVSRSNGVLEHLEADTDKGALLLELRECKLDEPLDQDLVDLPSEAKAAALDPEMTRRFQELFGPESLRRDAFLRVEAHLGTKKRPWNELTRNDWRSFLDALHRRRITEKKSEWIGQLHEWVDQVAEWVRTQRAENDSAERLAELQQRVAEDRAKLVENFDTSQSNYVERLPSIGSDRTEPRQELFDIEAEVVAELWDELLREPVLKVFDEKLDEALE